MAANKLSRLVRFVCPRNGEMAYCVTCQRPAPHRIEELASPMQLPPKCPIHGEMVRG